MDRKLVRAYRKFMPVLAAGVLLQTGGCAFDFPTLVSGLATSVANSFITSLVYGLFNVGTGF